MKIYSTKYALTIGIKHQEAELSADYPSMVVIPGELFSYLHGEGKEWHRTKESAIAKAESMRKSKIASLKKTIAKLESMVFE